MKTFLAVMLFASLAVGCDDSGNPGGQPDMTVPEKPDLSTTEQPDMTPACSSNPMTHVEIINACTNADSFDKMPSFPTLAPNGQLPPLQ